MVALLKNIFPSLSYFLFHSYETKSLKRRRCALYTIRKGTGIISCTISSTVPIQRQWTTTVRLGAWLFSERCWGILWGQVKEPGCWTKCRRRTNQMRDGDASGDPPGTQMTSILTPFWDCFSTSYFIRRSKSSFVCETPNGQTKLWWRTDWRSIQNFVYIVIKKRY